MRASVCSTCTHTPDFGKGYSGGTPRPRSGLGTDAVALWCDGARRVRSGRLPVCSCWLGIRLRRLQPACTHPNLVTAEASANKNGGAGIPPLGFGSSDSDCVTQLSDSRSSFVTGDAVPWRARSSLLEFTRSMAPLVRHAPRPAGRRRQRIPSLPAAQ